MWKSLSYRKKVVVFYAGGGIKNHGDFSVINKKVKDCTRGLEGVAKWQKAR